MQVHIHISMLSACLEGFVLSFTLTLYLSYCLALSSCLSLSPSLPLSLSLSVSLSLSLSLSVSVSLCPRVFRGRYALALFLCLSLTLYLHPCHRYSWYKMSNVVVLNVKRSVVTLVDNQATVSRLDRAVVFPLELSVDRSVRALLCLWM